MKNCHNMRYICFAIFDFFFTVFKEISTFAYFLFWTYVLSILRGQLCPRKSIRPKQSNTSEDGWEGNNNNFKKEFSLLQHKYAPVEG